jgi:hypothetical protein
MARSFSGGETSPEKLSVGIIVEKTGIEFGNTGAMVHS